MTADNTLICIEHYKSPVDPFPNHPYYGLRRRTLEICL